MHDGSVPTPAHHVPEDLGRPCRPRRSRASRRFCTSTCNWSTRSPARRPSKDCGWPAARSGGPSGRWPRRITTSRPPIATSRSPTRSRGNRSIRCAANCREFGIRLYDLDDPQQGIVHVIGPELGYTQPGMTIVCGDSHTATHGAFGALAFGIGTSEVEHVLATQTLLQATPKTMELRIDGQLAARRDGQGPDPVPDRPAHDRTAGPATCWSTPARRSGR